MNEGIALSVKGVSKKFRLHNNDSIKSQFVNILKGKSSIKSQKTTNDILNNINFEVRKGDFFGIVGRNGSGKSTLLKILAGIYTPDTGEVVVNGKLVPFIELGVGFNQELTGKDNVYLNGSLLGFSRKEMSEMYDEIVAFAELKDFMNEKLKNYSSGMQVRLAFSIAIKAKADVLVLDEVLAVGDEAFQRKCYQYFAEIRKNKQTVIFVSHNMDAIQQFCNRAMLIDKGHKTVTGNPLEISQIYSKLNDQDNITVNNSAKSKVADVGSRYIETHTNVNVRDEEIKIKVTLNPKQKLEDPILGVEIYRDSGEQIYRWVTDEKIKGSIVLGPGEKSSLRLSLENIFPVGVFTVRLLIRKRDRSQDYGIFNNVAKFEIKNKTQHKSNILWKPKEEYKFVNKND